MNIVTRLTALSIALAALVAPFLPCRASGSADEAPDRTPEQLVRTFWDLMIARSYDSAAALAWYPFQWDQSCRFMRTEAEFVARAAGDLKATKGETAPQLAVERVREVSPIDSTLDGAIRDLMEVFLRDTPCPEIEKAARRVARVAERRYVLVDLRVNRERIPTVTLVALIDGAWRVIGFNN